MKQIEVLVVDDGADCRAVLSGMLTARGCGVRVAESGEAALAAIEAHRPDIVLLDVMMPGLSGLEVLDRLRGNPVTATLPVILVSARSGDDDVVGGYQTGADYYITKPCTAQQVLRGIEMVLGREVAGVAA